MPTDGSSPSSLAPMPPSVFCRDSSFGVFSSDIVCIFPGSRESHRQRRITVSDAIYYPNKNSGGAVRSQSIMRFRSPPTRIGSPVRGCAGIVRRRTTDRRRSHRRWRFPHRRTRGSDFFCSLFGVVVCVEVDVLIGIVLALERLESVAVAVGIRIDERPFGGPVIAWQGRLRPAVVQLLPRDA